MKNYDEFLRKLKIGMEISIETPSLSKPHKGKVACLDCQTCFCVDIEGRFGGGCIRRGSPWNVSRFSFISGNIRGNINCKDIIVL